MSYTLFKDLLKKRQKKSMKLKSSPSDPSTPQPIPHSSKQPTIQSVLDKILKIDCKSTNKCQLSLQDKYTIIQHISDKQNLSYNRNTLIQLMTILRFPSTTYFQPLPQKPHHPQHHPQQSQQTLSSYCSFTNFYVLYGQVSLFQNHYLTPHEHIIQTFSTENILSQLVQKLQPYLVLEQNTSYGPIFHKIQPHFHHSIIKVNNAIIIEVKPPKLQNMLLNSGGMAHDKKIKAIQCFPSFGIISRRVSSILPYFQLKKYCKNQIIYKIKQQPLAVYLILKGQIYFQLKLESPPPKPQQHPTLKTSHQLTFQTQILGSGNYFGQEQIILKTTRALTAICRSVQCDLLEIPVDKFEKLLTYSDFFDQIKACAQLKLHKRSQKIQKSLQIARQYKNTPQKQKPEKYELLPQQLKHKILSKKPGIRKRSLQPLQIMHGNIIKKIPISRYCQPINFSMLHADPDMYQATLKKFRKYSIPAPQKYKPEVNWDLKRVWKILNLQNVLRQDIQINCPEARHFYQTHLRLQNRVQQSKSFRPKTSSSTYRTKLQYIAYLQQFTNY